MAQENVAGTWFRYFPEHYLWSQLMSSTISLTPMGGTNFQELNLIGRRLQGKVGDGEAWHDAWTWMADKTLALAESEWEKGHRRTAADAYVRSAIYRYETERFIPPTDPRKTESYATLLPHYLKGMSYRVPGFEKVDVPYENASFAAYWIPPLNPTGKDPVVVFFDGLDACKELTVLWGGLYLRERGIGVLCVDGPGQGETLRLRKIPSRSDYEVAGSAAFDFISQRPGVDKKRIGIMAMSMGGYYAPRIAAFEHRYAACFAWGAHFDYHEVWVHRRKVLESGGTISSSAIWQLPWVLGPAGHGSGDGEMLRVPAARRGREDPHADHDHARPRRQHRAGGAGASSLRGLRLAQEGAQDIHRRGRRQPALRFREPVDDGQLDG